MKRSILFIFCVTLFLPLFAQYPVIMGNKGLVPTE